MSNATKIQRVTAALKAETARSERAIAALASRGMEWLLDELDRTVGAFRRDPTDPVTVEITRIVGDESGWGEQRHYIATAMRATTRARVSRNRALAELLLRLRLDAKKQGIKIPRRPRNA